MGYRPHSTPTAWEQASMLRPCCSAVPSVRFSRAGWRTDSDAAGSCALLRCCSSSVRGAPALRTALWSLWSTGYSAAWPSARPVSSRRLISAKLRPPGIAAHSRPFNRLRSSRVCLSHSSAITCSRALPGQRCRSSGWVSRPGAGCSGSKSCRQRSSCWRCSSSPKARDTSSCPDGVTRHSTF